MITWEFNSDVVSRISSLSFFAFINKDKTAVLEPKQGPVLNDLLVLISSSCTSVAATLCDEHGWLGQQWAL